MLKDVMKKFDKKFAYLSNTLAKKDLRNFITQAITEALAEVKPDRGHYHSENLSGSLEQLGYEIIGYTTAIDQLEDNIKQYLEGEDGK